MSYFVEYIFIFGKNSNLLIYSYRFKQSPPAVPMLFKILFQKNIDLIGNMLILCKISIPCQIIHLADSKVFKFYFSKLVRLLNHMFKRM